MGSFFGSFQFFRHIGFWILCFLLVHCIGINYPPLEAAHSWRQATGLMVARNYFEGNTSFWFPMVDETNGGTGIIGMEFPILYYLQGKLGLLFGFHVGIGRFINVLITTLGIAYFYALVRRFAAEKTAFYATVAFMMSCVFMYSRKVMPDTEALSVYLIGIYYFFEALRYGKSWHIIFSFLLLSLGLLLKISMLPLLSFVVFAYFHFRSLPKKAWVLLVPLLSVLPACAWYFVWNPYLEKAYGNWYNTGGSLREGLGYFYEHAGALVQHLIFHPFYSYTAIVALIIGIYFAIKSHLDIAWKWTIPLFLALFSAYALKSGSIFITHDYYILPAVPPMALAVGFGLAKIGRIGMVLLLLLVAESLGNQSHDFRYNEGEAYKLELAQFAQSYIPKDALVAINGNSNPQELYFLHRKGWNVSDEIVQDNAKIKQMARRGCSYVVINKRHGRMLDGGQFVTEIENYWLYSLK